MTSWILSVSARCRAIYLASVLGSMGFPNLAASDELGYDAFFQRKDGVKVYFNVELANTHAKRSEGLMWREHLAPRGGMLFDFERSSRIRMWMKNTLVPLDMVFIDDQSRIVHFHENTEPLSLEIIETPLDARYTVEINAGEARDYALSVGDRWHVE